MTRMRRSVIYLLALTVTILALSVIICIVGFTYAFRAMAEQLEDQDDAALCRSRAAVALEAANGEREDALSDLLESLGRGLSTRDPAVVEEERVRLGEISQRIRAATITIDRARTDRELSVELCSEDPSALDG